MNDLENRVRQHRVWAEMEGFGPLLDRALALPDLSADELAYLMLFKWVLEFSGKRVAAADPLLTSIQTLDIISANMTQMFAMVSHFTSNRLLQFLINANNSADALTLALSKLPVPASPEELGSVVAAATQYRQFVASAFEEAEQGRKLLTSQTEAAVASAATQSRSVEDRVQALTTAIDAERQRLAGIATEQQGQFSTSQENRSKEFSETLRLSNESLAKLSTLQQGQFSAAQGARSSEGVAADAARQQRFSETLSDFSQKHLDFFSAAQKNVSEAERQYEERLSVLVADVEKKRLHVEKLVGVIGNLGVTSGYLRTANHARWGMWGWQAGDVSSDGHAKRHCVQDSWGFRESERSI